MSHRLFACVPCSAQSHKECIEHLHIRDKGIETPDLVGAQRANRREIFVENFLASFAGVMQVQRHILITINGAFDFDLDIVAVKSLGSLENPFNAMRFPGHDALSRQTPHDVIGHDRCQDSCVAAAKSSDEFLGHFSFFPFRSSCSSKQVV